MGRLLHPNIYIYIYKYKYNYKLQVQVQAAILPRVLDITRMQWIGLHNGKNFDVTMGSLGGAETCEIVGLFILNLLKSEINQDNLGMYRDDGLAIIKNANDHRLDNLPKKL